MVRLGVLVVVLLTMVVAIGTPLPAVSQEWLDNGDLEAGTSEWQTAPGTKVDCEAHEGSAALGLSASPPDGQVFRNVFGPLPAGSYTITGWTMVQSGSAQIQVTLAFSPQGGFNTPTSIATGEAFNYVPFSVTTSAIGIADSARLIFDVVPSGDAVVCIDSLHITTEDPTPTATPTPSPTSPPDATATFTATVTQPAATATAMTPTATSTPTATPSPTSTSGPTYAFTNGGFEQGLDGWRKYGGTLATTSNALSGTTSGLLISDTESTKWAYQTVRINPAQFYEFSGSVQADGGVAETLLRISWYPTSDGSGPAISTSDSLQRAGPGGVVDLTTGAVQPPPGAVTARLRVLLTPTSAAFASLRIDEVSFRTTDPPTPTPTPSPMPSDTPSPTPTFALLGAISATPLGTLGPTPGTENDTVVQASAASASDESPSQIRPSATVVPIAEVASTHSQARASEPVSQEPLSTTLEKPPASSGATSWPWIVGIALLSVGLGGAYVQNKRARR